MSVSEVQIEKLDYGYRMRAAPSGKGLGQSFYLDQVTMIKACNSWRSVHS